MDIAKAPKPQKAPYIIQLPIRIWHWSLVISIPVLIITGYIIGKPWHSLDGDTTYLFYMGYTRMAHFIAGFIMAIGMFCRLLYAFIGNGYSKQIFIIPIWKKEWRQSFLHDIKWYLFIERTPQTHMGHNPLAQIGMGSCVLLIFLLVFTGMGMYIMSSDNPLLVHTFQWVIDLAYWTGGNGIDLHSWHRLGMLFLIAFIIIHLYMVIREEIMGKTTLVSSMFSGFRQVRSTKND